MTAGIQHDDLSESHTYFIVILILTENNVSDFKG